MYIFQPSAVPLLQILNSKQAFPVHRIYGVGRNYADHAKEMGGEANTKSPAIFFQKPADALCADLQRIPYPSATRELHHEVELVIALHSGGENIPEEEANRHIFGYALGLDLTRRDLQEYAKTNGLPWDMAKGFDFSAPVGDIVCVSEIGYLNEGMLRLHVNEQLKQEGNIADMLRKPNEIVAELSKYLSLKAGDLIFTGTPAGVGPLKPGDRFTASFNGLPDLQGQIATAS